MNYGIKIGISTAITAFFAWLIYYLALPAMTLASPGMWWYLIVISGIFTLSLLISSFSDEEFMGAGISAIVTGAILLIFIIGAIVGSPLVNSHAYQSRLSVETTTFEEEIPEVDWNTVPQIDKDSSSTLGSRKLGDLKTEISQYNVMSNYTQINYGEKPVRVSPLGYASVFKYFNNRHSGIPGYIMVNGVSKEAEFVRIEEGMKYSPSACFGKDLKRYLRRTFRTTMFGDLSFEIDDNGKPYYIVPTYKYSAGIGGAKTPTGCILVDPVTGETKTYDMDNIPTWIDHAIDENIVVSMIDCWGLYQEGFWNAYIGQKNAKESTEGYNYVTIDNDVYLYTGITSVALDESNIGFMMVNMRTGKAKYFDMPSAEEYSAMDTAKGEIQEKAYTATFPILINAEGIPTYFLSLKDAAGLVKRYAFVAVENIQILSVTESSYGVEYGMQEYLKAVRNNPTLQKAKTFETSVTISEIYSASIEGNSYYYMVASDDQLYIANINTGKQYLPLLKVGDTVSISCYKSGDYYEVINVKNFISNVSSDVTTVAE